MALRTGRAAIMVRALGLPTVMGADLTLSMHRRTLVVDGYRGELLSEVLSRFLP
ncbi:PEP-utilizing enzyme [Shigella flexneri]